MNSKLRSAPLAALAVLFMSWAARAETAISIRPGLMCENEQSLAILTLSNGNSRADSPQAKPGDEQEVEKGKCTPITPGAIVTIVTTRAHTSIVTFDPGDGHGPRRFFVPNIDFDIPGVANPNPPEPMFQFYAELHKQCPANDWKNAVFAEFEAPLEMIRLNARQESELRATSQRECADGVSLSCRNGVAIFYMLRQGMLPQLVRAFCSIKPEVVR